MPLMDSDTHKKMCSLQINLISHMKILYFYFLYISEGLSLSH